MKYILLFLLVLNSFKSYSKYCVGVRGNGELALAHWSALSRTIENHGIPQKMAGGSSAAITLFFIDAISRNSSLTNIEKGLLLKTLVPHLLYIFNEDAKAPVVMRIIGNFTGLKKSGFFGKVHKALKIARDAPTFFKVLGEYGPLINPSLAKGLREDFSFYKDQAVESASVFGSFDAKTDENIFYRKGLVDFKYLSLLLGRIGDFYAGYANGKTNKAINEFLKTCSDVSYGKVWSEIISEKPQCQNLLTKAFDRYYEAPTRSYYVRIGDESSKRTVRKRRVFPNKMVFEKVGSSLEVFPTTALIMGKGEKRYLDNLKRYEESRAQDKVDFNIDFNSEIMYGYWGNSRQLDHIQSNLKTNFSADLKSSKFYPLKEGRWFEVLSTSPAEPGLSNLVRVPDSRALSRKAIINKRYFGRFLKIFPNFRAIEWFNEKNPKKGIITFRENLLSAGGWSDLHPSLVLRASGCKDIMYLTRQGGESVFGQQVFIRLTGYTDKISFWKKIKDFNRIGFTNLSYEEETSPWNRLYNLANPNSSYVKSIKESDFVYCTNWDKYNVFNKEIEEAIKDSYHAPIFFKDTSRENEFNFGKDFLGKSPDGFPGCLFKE